MFEAGKTYNLNGFGEIRVIRRTKCYVTYRYLGEVKRTLIGKGLIKKDVEYTWVPAQNLKDIRFLCYADNVKLV